jgi:hypothetical protein
LNKSVSNVLSVSMSRYKLPVVQKKTSLSIDSRSRAYSSALSSTLKGEEEIAPLRSLRS